MIWPLLAVAFVHSFSVAQSGLPLDAYGPAQQASTRASGSVTVSRPLAFVGVHTQRATRVQATFDYRVGGARIRFRAESAELTAFADHARLLDLEVRVVASTDPACPVGAEGDVYLLDDPAGADNLDVLLCPLRYEHYFNTLRGRVVVSIR